MTIAPPSESTGMTAANERTYFIATNLHSAAVPQHFHALGMELGKRGHRVVILRQAEYETVCNVDRQMIVHTWPSRRPTYFIDALFFFKLIRRYRPHCVLANFGAVNVMCAVGALFGVRNRIAYYHTLSSQIDQDTNLSHLMSRYLRFRKRCFYLLATHCIGVSRAAVQDLTTNFRVAPLKCSVRRLSLIDPHAESGRSGFTRSMHPVVACAGRLQPSKGQDVLIRALPDVVLRFPSLMVEFLGEGPMRSQCESLAKELGVERHCHFLGKISQTKVIERMSSAWLTVVPSRTEAFGLVNLESMSVGTPVIASNVGGIPDIVRDGTDGFLVPPCDPEALAGRLADLIGNSMLREQMGRYARERFLNTFEQSKVVDEQADWLESLP